MLPPVSGENVRIKVQVADGATVVLAVHVPPVMANSEAPPAARDRALIVAVVSPSLETVKVTGAEVFPTDVTAKVFVVISSRAGIGVVDEIARVAEVVTSPLL